MLGRTPPEIQQLPLVPLNLNAPPELPPNAGPCTNDPTAIFGLTNDVRNTLSDAGVPVADGCRAFGDDAFATAAASAATQQYLTDQQEAIFGCGRFWGFDCDLLGLDIVNAEGGALVQAWPGTEGAGGSVWDTFDGSTPQPGTAGFLGGPVCSRYDPATDSVITLPGCRGVDEIEVTPTEVRVLFEDGYDPTVDGCVFRDQIGGRPVVGVNADLSFCFNAAFWDRQTLYHPFAGCTMGPDGECVFRDQDALDADFLADPGVLAQIFRTELAALSWNALLALVATSLPPDVDEDGVPDREPFFNEFDPEDPARLNGCSWRQPYHCRSVSGFLAITGQQRNNRLAGGNPRFGRRDFVWHGGYVATLDYLKRNVLGFALDFAEDRTRANFGLEFTWFSRQRFVDQNSFDNNRTAPCST